MLKFFTIFFIRFISFIYVFSTSAENYIPKLQITPSAKDEKKFDVQTIGFWCPPETEEDASNVNRISHIPGKFRYKYCVFENAIKDENNMTCRREIKPIFLPHRNKEKQMIRCDANPDQSRFTYSFGFYYCGDTNQLEKFRYEFTSKLKTPTERYRVDVEVMYDICYDLKTNRALRTRHTIMKPPIFAAIATQQNNKYSSDFEINTDPFDLKDPDFVELKEKYELEKEKNSKTGMVPYPLVPPSHIALAIWKKATQHIINIASLWNPLVPLMFAIDEGLKKAQMKLYLDDPKNYDKLVIYTKVEEVEDPVYIIPKRIINKTNIKPNFPPTIWYKFIHRRNKNHGVLIHVHSTPNNTPIRKCRQVVCEFTNWIKDLDNAQVISEDSLQFAYCCQTNEEEVGKLFSIDVKIEDVLYLDRLIKLNRRTDVIKKDKNDDT